MIFGKLKDYALSCSYRIANSVYSFKTYSEDENLPVSKILMGASLNARPKFTHLSNQWITNKGLKLNTVNDLINARGVYLIFGVPEGAFNRWEAFKRGRRLFS